MPYCSECGVEVDAGVEACPLCKAPIHRSAECDEAVRPHAAYPDRIIDPEDRYHLTATERRRIAVELLSLAFGLAGAVIILVDLVVNQRLGWSLYALVSVGFAWLVSAMPLILYGKPWLVFTVLAPALPLFLFLIDVFDGRGIGWFLPYGFPIAGAGLAAVASVGAVVGASRRKGLNVIATVFLGAAIFMLILEGILDLNRGGLSPYWSAIAALALAPTAVVLYFLHGRVLRGADLRKVFRL
ncbi:MAG: hypothetical protein JXA15_04125 [Spirochaetales bacterium]|nr:hypothetical protein [Spirochaetales bacterium]